MNFAKQNQLIRRGQTFRFAAIFIFGITALSADGHGQSIVPVDEGHNHSLLLYGGLLARDNWKSVLFRPQDTEIIGSQMLGLAYGYTHWRAADHRSSMDIEAQLIRHFGRQSHFEVNAVPLVGRWHDFPWDEWINTTAAFGLGLSYAMSAPEAEAIVREEARKMLFTWFFELAFASPVPQWEVVTRLHHRSGGFGIFSSPGKVGSDFVTVGLRHRF